MAKLGEWMHPALDESGQVKVAPRDTTIDNESLKLDIYKQAEPIISRLKAKGIDTSSYEEKLSGLIPDMSFAEKSGVVGRKIGEDYLKSFGKLVGGEYTPNESAQLDRIKYDQQLTKNPISTVGMDILHDPTTYIMPSSKAFQAETALGRFGKGAMINAPIAGGSYAAREYGNDNFDWGHAGIAAGAGGVLGGLLNIPFGKPTAKASTQADMLSDEEKARRMMGGQTLPEKAPPIDAEVVDPFNQQVMDDWAKFQNGEMSLEELRAKYQRFKKQPTQLENKGVIPQPQLENNHAINMGAEGWSQPLGHRIQGDLDAKAGEAISNRSGYIGSPVANALAGGGTGSLAPIDYNQDGEVSAEDRALSALLGAVGATRLAGKFSKGAKQMPKEAPNGMRNGMIVGAKDDTLFHTSRNELNKLDDNKVFWTTPDLFYSKKFGQGTDKNTYAVRNAGDLRIADIQDSQILREINSELPKNKQFSEAGMFSDNGEPSAFLLQEPLFVAKLKERGFDALKGAEDYKGNIPSIGIFNKQKQIALSKNESGNGFEMIGKPKTEIQMGANTRTNAGINNEKIVADTEYLQQKHPENFSKENEVKREIDKTVANGTHFLEANSPNNSIIAKRENGKDSFLAVQKNNNPNEVRSVFVRGEDKKQLERYLKKQDSELPTSHSRGENLASSDEILPQSTNGVNPSLGVPAVGAGLMSTSEQLKADDGSMSPLGSMLAMAGAGALAYKFGGKALKGADALASKGLSKVAQSIDNITANKISQGWESFTNNSIVDKLLGTKIYKLDDYMRLRSDYTKALNPTMEKLEKLHVQLAEFNQATREAMYDYMSGVKGVQLSPAIQKVADNFRSEIDKMTDELVQLGALDAKSADAFKGSYLHRSYTSKMGDIRGVLNGARKTLSDVKHRGHNWEGSEKEYQGYLQSGELGDFKDGKIVANKRADGSYQFYQDWSPTQRSKWGEIKDVAFSIPETIGRMAERLENAKFLKAISEDSRYVAPKGMSDDEAKALGFVKLSGKRYGQLDGMNVRAEIATDIKAFSNMVYGEDSTLKEAWKQAVSYIKSTHTIYNPAAHVNNVMSNITFSFMAGANPMTAVKSAMTGVLANRKAKEALTLEAISSVRTLSAEESSRLQTLLMDDDVQLFKQAKLKGLFGKSNLNDTLMSYVKPRTKSTNSTVQNIHQKAGNFYGAEDDMMRYGLLKAFKNQNPRASIDELINMVNKNIPDYTKPMSSAAQTLRDTGFVPFIAFPYYSMPIILKQMKDRPVSAATMIAMMGVLYGANDINPFSGDDIPDEGYAFKRIPIVKNGNVVHTIKVDKWLPHYDLISSVTDFSQGIAPEFLRGMLTGGIPQNLIGGAFNYNPYFNQRVTQKEGLEKAYQLGKHNVQQLTPDVLDNAYNLAESKLVDKKKRRYNKVIEPRSQIQESMKMLGINLQSYNQLEQSRKNRAEKIK